jgi:hypothetical protein
MKKRGLKAIEVWFDDADEKRCDGRCIWLMREKVMNCEEFERCHLYHRWIHMRNRCEQCLEEFGLLYEA